MPPVVRLARAADGPRVWQLLQQFAASYVPDDAAFAETFPRICANRNALFIVADDGDAAVGYLVAVELPTFFANGPILEIVELVVDEPRRGVGLGKALVEYALNVAWQHGCIEVVVPTRRATAFYERLGFSKSADLLKLKKSEFAS